MKKYNKTEIWKNSPPSTTYELPQNCPTCGEFLVTVKMDIGTFPYIYTDITTVCPVCLTTYNFCYPQHPAMATGQHIYDTEDTWYWIEVQIEDENIKLFCPFHDVLLEIQRYYGNLTYSDGTQKVQMKCPKCNYYRRVEL